MNIFCLAELTDNYLWAIQSGQQVIAIDPPSHHQLLHYMQQHKLNLAALLITHRHADHTSGIAPLLEALPYNIPIFAYDGFELSTSSKPQHISHAETVNIPNFPTLHRIYTPGHTSEHVAYIMEDAGTQHIFSADILFGAGCGRIFDGKPWQLWQSLEKIKQYPAKSRIYAAHEYTLSNLHFAVQIEPDNVRLKQRLKETLVRVKEDKTLCTVPLQLKEELETNPFLRCDNPVVQASVKQWKIKVQLPSAPISAEQQTFMSQLSKSEQLSCHTFCILRQLKTANIIPTP
jgi:hydroxyacylglutathione hydrolase